ncbi:1-acyl-sn-glycerol-3-phosphate acyltransferase [Ahrensia sp. R2A130]|uniref:lysophospholipid acyltransferase family protein n=1 Tax=Ahrensia sp. R2A130 TaxID=744979 RepID=UPI0001E09C80|nr:1-acyl-sn-glycerol-3-phosphate acyltransferase [Ahrensia sp. R2A130]EFL88373.1 1-acyl-sn-glycerol-3-phosphate acyltransferase [Ahrensia sp. R2A130]
MAQLRLVLALTLAVIWLLLLLPFHLVALLLLKFGLRFPAGRMPVLFHKGLLFLFGVRCHVSNKMPKDRPLLLVSNHVSWLDIVVLGSIAPLSFVAKSDMKSWPVFGQLAQLQRTVFVERGDRRGSAIQAGDIAERMVLNEVMVLFPEGTTTDHNRIEPFKTSLFEAAKLALKESEVDHATVQPVAIHYTHLHGLPLTRAERPHVSWPGEIGIGESILPLVRVGALDVHVKLGEPVVFDASTHRKRVAATTREAIEAMLDPSRG